MCESVRCRRVAARVEAVVDGLGEGPKMKNLIKKKRMRERVS